MQTRNFKLFRDWWSRYAPHGFDFAIAPLTTIPVYFGSAAGLLDHRVELKQKRRGVLRHGVKEHKITYLPTAGA
jgi:hypothetical protein